MTDRRYQALDLAIKAGEPKRADEFYLWLGTGRFEDTTPVAVIFFGPQNRGEVHGVSRKMAWGYALPEILVDSAGGRIPFTIDGIDGDAAFPNAVVARIDDDFVGLVWGVYFRPPTNAP